MQTSNTAAFLLYELARHPEIQERLVQEISSVVGDKEHPSWEDVQKMTLLKNCVKEILRIYVPGDITFRVLDRSTELMGYQVPAGVSGKHIGVGSRGARGQSQRLDF